MPPPFKMTPNAALAEMLVRDGELDRILDGRGLTFTRSEVIEQPAPTAQPFYMPPPDWEAERLERLEREAAERAAERAALLAEAASELEPAEPPERPTAPAQKKRWGRAA